VHFAFEHDQRRQRSLIATYQTQEFRSLSPQGVPRAGIRPYSDPAPQNITKTREEQTARHRDKPRADQGKMRIGQSAAIQVQSQETLPQKNTRNAEGNQETQQGKSILLTGDK
jgi:hypothetical protein